MDWMRMLTITAALLASTAVVREIKTFPPVRNRVRLVWSGLLVLFYALTVASLVLEGVTGLNLYSHLFTMGFILVLAVISAINLAYLEVTEKVDEQLEEFKKEMEREEKK